MSPEDVREDLIDNEPSPFADDISVDEKTWDWWASRQPVSETVISAPQINRHLYAPTVAIDFLWTADLLCLLLLSGGTRLDHCVITTKGSASVRHSAIERQRHMDETSINYLAVHRTLKVSPFCLCFLEAVEIGPDMPSEAVMEKWLGEPIKAAILPTSIFLTNKKGFPVLSKAHQQVVFSLFKVTDHWIQFQLELCLVSCCLIPSLSSFFSPPLVGGPVHFHRNQPPHGEGLPIVPAVSGVSQSEQTCTQRLRALCQGLRRLPAVSTPGTPPFWSCLQDSRSRQKEVLSYFCDVVMRADFVLHPQPLMDNLESQTYEVFEKDPIKYSQYQQVKIQMPMFFSQSKHI